MIEVIEIENALDRINGDIFQEFCNHFLYLKLNPNTITPIGSVIGKEKSRKGIPDSYLTSIESELVFAEFTTRERLKHGESFYSKLKADIDNCFNSSKSGLQKDKINKVILCFTERIRPDEQKKLEELCCEHNPKCTLELKGIRDLAFAVLDYPILGNYLGIKVGTGQIQEPSEFIANYEKNKISTPLSNTLIGREKEIEDGINLLDKNDILLVHGAAGTGKSKYSLELARLYSDKNHFSFLCIGNKGIPIWEDLKLNIKANKKQEELGDYCKGFDIHKYDSLFNSISSILQYVKKVSRDNLVWQYEGSLNIIFTNLAKKDAKLFLETLKLNFAKYRFNLNYIIIFNQFFKSAPQLHFEFYNLIRNLEPDIKLCYHQTLDVDTIDETNLSQLYADLLTSLESVNNQYNFWNLTFISKYQIIKEEKEIYLEVLGIILKKIKQEEVNISVGRHFIDKCTKFDIFPTGLLIEAYLYSNKFEHIFDHDKRLFRELLCRDSSLIIQLLKFNYPDKISYHDIEHENYDVIWDLDNYIAIINSVFDYFISNEIYYFSERVVSAFFPMVKDKYGKKTDRILGNTNH